MTEQLPLFSTSGQGLEIATPLVSSRGQAACALEDTNFPFEYLCEIAELESWRKEIHRPIYHIHKWWAQRLGSVFRAVILGAFAPAGSNILDLFYTPVRLPNVVIFDPFMGSGTTIGETLKVGGRAVGRDINPVAYFHVRNALNLPAREDLLLTFQSIEEQVSSEIQRFYQAKLPDGGTAPVLYYFWVKQVMCPLCHHMVDLFSSYIFAHHAYTDRQPDARAICPSCGTVNIVRHDSRQAVCVSCHYSFNPASGPARGARATCQLCHGTFTIIDAVRRQEIPPFHRLYAKLILTPSGDKEYVAADSFDRALYEEAEQELAKRANAYPAIPIKPGHNTDQVLNYSYRFWHQMFNSRQLLCLSILADCIREIPDQRQRELFCCLFSGVLEFNNMFSSFKGEGTGAVRHMFYHHILKPERTPLEANVWGTPQSSGSFSTLFAYRILRALDYCDNPFEIRVERRKGKTFSKKIFGLSLPLFHHSAQTFAEFEKHQTLYLSCADSAHTDVVDETVDAVITDPPFFDNVHYSELADFFYVWQRHILGPQGYYISETTRSPAEVQSSNAVAFVDRLGSVWKECHRVLKADGVLVFTYHHSRSEGWRSILASLLTASFFVTCAHPIKGEMSVATPKHLASEPIDLDMILVCRKKSKGLDNCATPEQRFVEEAVTEAGAQIQRLRNVGRILSRNDVGVVLMAQIVTRLSRLPDQVDVWAEFDKVELAFNEIIDRLNRVG